MSLLKTLVEQTSVTINHPLTGQPVQVQTIVVKKEKNGTIAEINPTVASPVLQGFLNAQLPAINAEREADGLIQVS